MIVANGSADVTTYFVLRDSTNHAPKTDITMTDIDLYYVEAGAAISGKTDATALAAADSAHSDGGAFHCGYGLHRIDWPDAAFDGGAGKTVTLIVVCSGVDTTFLEVELSPKVQTNSVTANAINAAAIATGAIDADAVAAGAIHVSAIANTAIRAAMFDTAAITATALAADCITANKIAANAIHATAMAQNSVRSDVITPAAYATIADDVWDEAAAGHTDAGKAGEQLWTDVDAILTDTGTTLDGKLPAALVGGKMDSHVTDIANNAITAAAIATDAIDADAIAASAVTEIQSGLALEATLTAIKGAGWTTETLHDIRDAIPAAAPSAATVADAVWDEQLIGHLVPGAAGDVLDQTTGLIAGVTDAVWDEAIAGHAAAGSAGKALTDANNGTPPTAGAVADAVWDEVIAGHAGAGSTGAALSAATAPSAATVADAVWDEALAGHAGAGSAGQALAAAGGAADPLLNNVPGAYVAGTAGYALGQIGDIYAVTEAIDASDVTIVSVGAASALTMRRGDKWDVDITGLGSVAARTALIWTAKRTEDDTDAQAIITIRETTGLTVLNGAAPVAPIVAGDGSLVVDNQALGNISLVLSAAATLQLLSLGNVKLVTSVKMLSAGGGAVELATATLDLDTDISRALV